MSKSPVHKRLKLDPSASPSPPPEKDASNPLDADKAVRQEDASSMDAEDNDDHCVICLQHIRDRTLLPCAHDRMCFECILIWTEQSRKCPLCNAPIGPFLIHNMRSKYDYQKRYLVPLRTLSPPLATPLLPLRAGNGAHNSGRPVADRWGPQSRGRRSSSRRRRDMEDALEIAVSRRKWVYRHKLFAKHVASNPYTRYRPAPTPAQIAASPDIISRATIFVRRELRVWVNLDVEFLTTFILSLMKSLDLRSESAVKLLAEFLDMDTPYYIGSPSESTGRFTNAEHFAHELYSYLRSPYRDLAVYDSVVQYDVPENVPQAPSQSVDEHSRWELCSPAETSPHRSPKAPRSPLPHSHQNVNSRSPSPVDSEPHEERSRHPSRSTDLLRSPQIFSTRATANGKGREVTDRKGKSKEMAHQRHDGDFYRREDNRSRRSRHVRARKHSRSPGRISELTGHHSHGSRNSRDLRPSLDASKVDTGDGDDSSGGPSKANSPLKSTKHITTAAVSKKIVDVLDLNSSGDQEFIPPSVIPETWGISIKGQAKLLRQTQDSGGQQHAHESRPDGLKDQSSGKVFLTIDTQEAELDRISCAQHGSASHAPAADLAHEQNGETLVEQSVSQYNDPALLSDSGPKSSMSAPEIMARTRAKRAKLRSQLSVTGIASTEGGGTIENKPESLGLKKHLLERLEEERQKSSTQSGGDRDSARINRPKSDDFEPNGSTAPEGGVVISGDGEDMRSGATTHSRQVEAKLRAQALLRVRLAAEKRKYEGEQTASREDALRAKLQSRKV